VGRRDVQDGFGYHRLLKTRSPMSDTEAAGATILYHVMPLDIEPVRLLGR